MLLTYIHGANATPQSFNYLRKELASTEELLLEYDSSLGFKKNLEAMKEIVAPGRDIFFIAHSLGGIYALHLANEFPKSVRGAVTLSTPYGGVEIAEILRFFLPHNMLIRDVGPSSWPIQRAREIDPKKDWTNIVTTRGSCIWMSYPNDGVVSVNSQRCLADVMDLVEVYCNHYEVVLNNTVIDIIKHKILEQNT